MSNVTDFFFAQASEVQTFVLRAQEQQSAFLRDGHMRVLLIAAVCMTAIGCMPETTRLLEHEGALRVEPGREAGEYVVSLRNLKTVTAVDLDNKTEREWIALAALKHQCPAGRVVGETAINTGTYAFGDSARTYAVRVKCA